MASENITFIYMNQTWIRGNVLLPVYLNFSVSFIICPWGMNKALPDYLESTKTDITSGFLWSTDGLLQSVRSVHRHDQVTAGGWGYLMTSSNTGRKKIFPYKDTTKTQVEKRQKARRRRKVLGAFIFQIWLHLARFLFASSQVGTYGAVWPQEETPWMGRGITLLLLQGGQNPPRSPREVLSCIPHSWI